ncbi:MAG: restriction endonuclease [Candidatus Binatia bacterium]
MPEHDEPRVISPRVRSTRRHSPSFRVVATLVLVVFATLVLHGNWLLACLLTAGGLGIWQVTEGVRLCRRRQLMLRDADAMSDEEFRLYIVDLLRAQGYGALPTNIQGDHQRDLYVVYGAESYTCRLVRDARRLGKGELAKLLGRMKLYGGRRPMVVTNRIASFPAARFAYRVGCVLIDRYALIQLISQYRQGHRVYTFHREEATKLRKRR